MSDFEQNLTGVAGKHLFGSCTAMTGVPCYFWQARSLANYARVSPQQDAVLRRCRKV